MDKNDIIYQTAELGKVDQGGGGTIAYILAEYNMEVIDCGVAFPDDEMYGVDLIIPDVSYLINNKEKVRGLVLTHGHEDHIGAIPYILKQINMPSRILPALAQSIIR